MTRGRPLLYVLTDETLQHRFGHAELARRAALGGADWVQLREKRRRSAAELVATGREVVAAVAGSGVKVIVDDRVDVAVACGADGVHLGPRDLDPGVARGILGRDALVGATANDLSAALRMARCPVDYLGVGPVFATTSKEDPPPVLGLEALVEIVIAVDVPVVAIGGIDAHRVGEVLATGVAGVAVMGTVLSAEDPEEAVREIRQAMAEASATRVAGAESP